MVTIENKILLSFYYSLAKQTLDNSFQVCVDRYWTEILLNSLIFDRNTREVNFHSHFIGKLPSLIQRDALDTLTVNDMQQWYHEHIIAPTRRQLIIIICSTEEIKRTETGIILNSTVSQGKNNRYSIRSSFGVPTERLPRLIRCQDYLSGENEEGHISVSKSKSESKLRCLTTKRTYKVDLRSTKSEALHLNKPFDYPNDRPKLDYILKSFELIELNDDDNRNHYRKSLKILFESDGNKPYISIKNLKQFKESCLLYNVTCIK